MLNDVIPKEENMLNKEKNFFDFKMVHKILGVNLVILLAVSFFGVYLYFDGLKQLSAIEKQTNSFNNLSLLENIESDFSSMRNWILYYSLTQKSEFLSNAQRYRDGFISTLKKIKGLTSEKVRTIKRNNSNYYHELLLASSSYQKNLIEETILHVQKSNDYSKLIEHEINLLVDTIQSNVDQVSNDSLQQANSKFKTIFILIFFIILLGLSVSLALIKNIKVSLAHAIQFAEDIAKGKLDSQIQVRSNDEIGQFLVALNMMKSNINKLVEQKIEEANKNLRIKTALDFVSGNIMLCDCDFNIIYKNCSFDNLLNKYQEEFKNYLSNFTTSNVLGRNINLFFSNQYEDLKNIKNSPSRFNFNLKIGRATFDIIVNPVFNHSNDLIGVVFEWNDRTLDLLAENEVNEIVVSAAKGDLGHRISLHDKRGFHRKLSESINQVVIITEQIVNDMSKTFDALSVGNLTNRVTGNYQGEYAKVQKNANKTIDILTDIINKILSSANIVKRGAMEIAIGIIKLNERTESQASSLEETSTSMKNMTKHVYTTVQQTEQAQNFSKTAKVEAENGVEVVGKAIKAMDAINGSSRKISEIISVINDIAFQTNLLALNAAVEAARAGEQGRGFAVVASEVRNLAQRSAEASKEIKALIDDSVQKVADGTKLVNTSGKALHSISQAVQKVNAIIEAISKATIEQSEAIEHVNKAVEQMNMITQQNVALVEEETAASESVDNEAKKLVELMGFFATESTWQIDSVPQEDSENSGRGAYDSSLDPFSDKISTYDSKYLFQNSTVSSEKSSTDDLPGENSEKDGWEEF